MDVSSRKSVSPKSDFSAWAPPSLLTQDQARCSSQIGQYCSCLAQNELRVRAAAPHPYVCIRISCNTPFGHALTVLVGHFGQKCHLSERLYGSSKSVKRQLHRMRGERSLEPNENALRCRPEPAQRFRSMPIRLL